MALAFGFYLLSEANREWPANAASRLYADRNLLGVTSKAYLALALGGMDSADPRIETLIKEIVDTADYSSSYGLHWIETNSQYMNTDTHTTAIVLEMLLSLDSAFPELQSVVNWLISSRQGKNWVSPHETAWALHALGKYYTASGFIEPSYDWNVTLNGQPLLDNDTESEATVVYEKNIRVGESSDIPLVIGENRIEYMRSAGLGNLYFSSNLTIALPMGDIKEEIRGITLLREYCYLQDALSEEINSLDTHCTPVKTISNGAEIEARLTIIVPEERYNLTLIDVIPSGFLPVDRFDNLLSDGSRPSVDLSQPFATRFCNKLRCNFFEEALAPGTYQIIYRLQAKIPGVYHAMPAKVYETYNSEVWAQSYTDVLTILAK